VWWRVSRLSIWLHFEVLAYITNVSAYITNVSTYIANVSAYITNVSAYIANVSAYIANVSTYIANVSAYITNVSAYIANAAVCTAYLRTSLQQITGNTNSSWSCIEFYPSPLAGRGGEAGVGSLYASSY